MEAEELVAVVETLAAENAVYRMARVVELDEHVLVAGAMTGTTCPDHSSELGPILPGARPMPKSIRSGYSVANSEKASATLNAL